MRTSILLLKLSLSMNSAVRRTMSKVGLPLLFLALLVYVLSQPMRAGRIGFVTDAAFASRSASKAVSGGDIAQSTTCFPPPAGLVSWRTAEGNANDLRDGNHGQLEGGAAYAGARRVSSRSRSSIQIRAGSSPCRLTLVLIQTKCS